MFQRFVGILLLLATIVAPGFAALQDPDLAPVGDLSIYEGRPRLQALRLNAGEQISVDGRLDEPIWQRAVAATDFIQQDPDLGSPATERTEVRIVFSRTTLYIGVTCYDSEPENLRGNTMQRDGSLAADDRFIWSFDPFLDGRTGYAFEVNPSGAMGDSLISPTLSTVSGVPTGGLARAWDGIWYAQVEKSEIGWTVEIEIPFRTLSFDPNAPAWGANYQRTVRRLNEESLWTGWLRNQSVSRMSSAGLLEGISEVTQGIGLEVQPYAIGRYVDATGRDGTSDFEPDGGVDFNYSITPQLKANLTINTDFAETEVDRRRINLTRFPLFFPERRAFFLDGSTFFDFTQEPSSDRQITPFFSRRIGLDANGQPQRIDYGAKLTGQMGPHDIGLLQVRTGDSDGLAGEDFTALRVKRRFFLESFVGLLYTRRAERDTGADTLQTVGFDFALGTSRFRGSQNLQLSGYYLRTTRTGPEGTAAFGFRVDYPNTFWDARLTMREIGAGYDPAVGFLDRRGIRVYYPAVAIVPRPENSIVRNYLFEANLQLLTDLENRLLTRNLRLILFQAVFQSGDRVIVRANPRYERLERNFRISEGITLPNGGEYSFTRYAVQASTSSRRVVSASTTYEDGTFYSGNRRDFSFDLGLRPRSGMLINFDSEWSRVELPEGNFSTHVMRLSSNNQFNPWTSFINGVQYDSVSRILGWQFRFRWILRPGNDLHFVYRHNWLDDIDEGLSTLDRSASTKLVYTHRF